MVDYMVDFGILAVSYKCDKVSYSFVINSFFILDVKIYGLQLHISVNVSDVGW